MLARQYMEVQAIIKRWSRRYDDRLLDQLIYMPGVKTEDFDRADWLRDWAQELNQRLNGLADGTRTYRVEDSNAADGHAAPVLIYKTVNAPPSDMYLLHQLSDITTHI